MRHIEGYLLKGAREVDGLCIYISCGDRDGTFIAPPAYEVSWVLSHMAVTNFNGDGNADNAALVQFEPGAVPIPVFSATASIAFVLYRNGDGRFSSPVAAGVFDRIYTGIRTAGTATLTITTTAATGSAAVNTRSRGWPWYAGSGATLA